jgi:hypothetical protein
MVALRPTLQPCSRSPCNARGSSHGCP